MLTCCACKYPSTFEGLFLSKQHYLLKEFNELTTLQNANMTSPRYKFYYIMISMINLHFSNVRVPTSMSITDMLRLVQTLGALR